MQTLLLPNTEQFGRVRCKWRICIINQTKKISRSNWHSSELHFRNLNRPHMHGTISRTTSTLERTLSLSLSVCLSGQATCRGWTCHKVYDLRSVLIPAFTFQPFFGLAKFCQKAELIFLKFKMKWFRRVSIAKIEVKKKKNLQSSIFGFQLVSTNIEGWLSILYFIYGL